MVPGPARDASDAFAARAEPPHVAGPETRQELHLTEKYVMLKWIGSGVVALGLVTLPAAVPAAQAHEWEEHHYRHYHHECFEVMYRTCCTAPWTCYGRFDDRERAEHAEHHLRRQGFEAFVRR
jgi:hypothetical protein